MKTTYSPQKIAILAPQGLMFNLISKAVAAGYMPINTISGEIIESDLRSADCFIAVGKFTRDIKMSYYANVLWDMGKKAVSLLNFETDKTTSHNFNSNGKTYTVFTYCPFCKKELKTGTIEAGGEKPIFRKWNCSTCGKVEPICQLSE